MTTIERRFSHAVLDAIFPRDASDDLSVGILDLDVDEYLDDTLVSVPVVSAVGMRAAFVAIALSPPVTIARLCTIDRLEPEDRVRVLDRLSHAPVYHVRQLVVLAKTTGAMLYCAAPAARAVMLHGVRGVSRPHRISEASEPAAVAGEVAHVPA